MTAEAQVLCWLDDTAAILEAALTSRRQGRWVVGLVGVGLVSFVTTMAIARAHRPAEVVPAPIAIAATPIVAVTRPSVKATPPSVAPVEDPHAVLVRAQALAATANRELDRGQIEKAITDAHRASALVPDEPAAYLVLGAAYQTQGNDGQARSAYRRYLELAPNATYASEVRSVLRAMR